LCFPVLSTQRWQICQHRVILPLLEVKLILRPEKLEIIKVEIEFNFQKFDFLEIDIDHVNKNGRSEYTGKEVMKIFTKLVGNLNLAPSDEKSFGDEMCSYFVRSGEYKNKSFKTVFCICSDRPVTIGVITLHRV